MSRRGYFDALNESSVPWGEKLKKDSPDMFESECNPDGISKADLVVCVLTDDQADSVRVPARQASEGLVKYFPDKQSVLVNWNTHSPDGRKEAFFSTPTDVPKIFLSAVPDVDGKASNLSALFRKFVELGAKGILLADVALSRISPEWVRRLAEPLFKGFAYVAPLYTHRRYDGNITSGIAYPMVRALFGRRLRQPMGRELGFSGDLARIYADSPSWDMAMTKHGNPIWMSTVALTHGAHVCQSFLGSARIQPTQDPSASLAFRFEEAAKTLFVLMDRFQSHWLGIKYSKPTAIVGLGENTAETPGPLSRVDYQSLYTGFQDGFSRFEPLWGTILAKDVFLKLLEIKGMKEKVYDFPTDLWARILYEMSVAFRDRVEDPGLLVKSLFPLFQGKTLCFMKKTSSMAPRQIEGVIEEDCAIFEMTKPYLVKRWKEGHRPASPSRS